MTKPTIPMNDFVRQWADTGPAVLDAVRVVGESGWYVLGPEVESFETALAAHAGRRFAVGCASGLDAIEIALRALGLKPGEKVLTTPLSAFATTLAILRAGGRPVFVDVDRSGLIDLERAARLLARDPSIRYLVPVHLFGHACDLDALTALKSRTGVRIVEDCAQAIGAHFGPRPVGSAGEFATLSFYPTKNLGALGDGGAILTDDETLRDRCRALRDYGQTTKYVHEVVGLNSRLDELHAAVLARVFLKHLPAWTLRRKAIASRYLDGIKDSSVRAVPVPPGSGSVWHLFPILVEPSRREAFCRHLREAGVGTAIHYPLPITRQRALAEQSAFDVDGDLPNVGAFAASEVSLPINPYLRDDEVDTVVDVIRKWKPR